ncbi:hypothetical protein H8E77_10360 [bacterium]|nr:hypothetical protein [bacterium]
MRITSLETGHKIQLPAEWATEFGLESIAVLEKTDEGILIRPYSATTWDDIFAEKLKIGRQFELDDLSEVSGDDLLF